MLANFSGVLYFLWMIQNVLSRGASLWIMQTTQKFTRQIPFPRLEHFNSDVANTLHLFTSCKASESKIVLDSGFHVVDSRFQVLDSSLCQWNLDSGFQSLVGFRIPWAVFRIPKPGIPDSISKFSWFQGSLAWGELVWAKQDEGESWEAPDSCSGKY